ncbi:MAG: N-acetyltransferase family protein [Pseudobdellovibrionaceae bacterium]
MNSKTQNHCQITWAQESDIPTILQFIKDLAVYEKLEQEVVANVDLLEKNLFGPNKFAEVILLKEDQVAVGFALFFHSFSTFLALPGIYLEDLFVQPEHRGKGYGKMLLAFLAQVAVDRKCGRFEWSVLDWNKPSIDFYLSLGAQSKTEWIGQRLTGQALKDLAAENCFPLRST